MLVKIFINKERKRYFSNFTREKEIESVGRPEYARLWSVNNVGRMSNYYNFKRHNSEYLTQNGYEPTTVYVEKVEK